ncbi:putative LPS assembly protein LptD [Robiginitalea sp. SC105]|uniref:putative LPS assembly protein LptD n=1 Tax=Robiginitalea sp. SC105 TaxID=2762332 RepID=UPI001639B692|nr:putative LPS assembly protein LptD [Robiginitalea sp. SC105]MBC2840303.1 LPS-assembly protein LptD [Robiginitalea sp. SC105]
MLLTPGLMSAQEDIARPLPVKPLGDTLVAPQLPADLPGATVAADTTRQSVPGSQGTILDQIKYNAKDYVRISQREQKIYLYNEAEIYYQDTELKAGIIVLDYVRNEVYAGRMKDSLGNYSQLPYFKQGENEVIPDSIRFNFDTEKAIIWNSRSEQQAGLGQLGSDAMKVYAQRTKKENDSVYFLSEGKLTTSKDTIDPDYYIRVRKAKFVPKKKVIAGYSNLYIVDVPTPIALPFAYFPLTTGRTAGIMMPTFGNDPNRGYFLQNGGYYLPISDYVDLTLTGDLYTNGSYGFRTQSVYSKRYRFRGNVNFRYENLVRSQKGFDDYSRTTIYNIQVSHTQDPKANPNSRFSASVNLGSSQYYRNSLLQQNLPNTQVNDLSSSVSYSKTFPAYPSVNVSLTATHNQNTNTDAVSVTLPTLQASMERIFPLAPREGVKKGVFQNINFQYDLNARNSIQTTTEDFLTGRMFDEAQMGARHRIPLATNFKVAKFFSVSLGGTYEDVWTWQTQDQVYDPETETIVRDTIQGFDRFNQYSLNASLGTTLYGQFNFGEDRKIQAIRHVVRPTVSYGWAPSFDQYYEEEVNQATGESLFFTRFQGSLYGSPRQGQSNSMSFSLANTLEAKVRDRDSTATEPKKIFLLNSLNFSTSYNFEADSLKLSPISMTGGTNLFDNKVSVNFGANLDPYAIDNTGRRINTLNVNNGGGLLRITNARLNVTYRLSSKDFEDRDTEIDEDNPYDGDTYVAASGGRTDDLFGRANDLNATAFDNRDPDDIENPAWGSKIPWNLNLSYAMNYSNTNRNGQLTNHVLMFNGNVTLAPRWDVSVSSSYDFVRSGFGLTRLGFARDLKSFKLTFDWTPFGNLERWYFFIGIKASILSDLKWENRSQRSNFN